MDVYSIINELFPQEEKASKILIEHSECVTTFAIEIATNLQKKKNPLIDIKFIEQAAMLHDIGICKVNAPGLGCFGDLPYICHGQAGHEILANKKLFKHANVCENHVGMGLTAFDIKKQTLPLIPKDTLPKTIEEKIICFADKFFSKSNPGEKQPFEKVQKTVNSWGDRSITTFNSWAAMFLS